MRFDSDVIFILCHIGNFMSIEDHFPFIVIANGLCKRTGNYNKYFLHEKEEEGEIGKSLHGFRDSDFFVSAKLCIFALENKSKVKGSQALVLRL